MKCVLEVYYGRRRSLMGIERDLGSKQKGKESSMHVTPCVTRVEGADSGHFQVERCVSDYGLINTPSPTLVRHFSLRNSPKTLSIRLSLFLHDSH